MGISLEAVNELEDAIDRKIRQAASKQTRAYGEVSRIEADGTVYVLLDGAESDTPASGNAAAVKEGERVSVTVDGGQMVIDGNYSAPATDDTAARAAQRTADSAAESAATAASAAADAVSSAAVAADAAAAAQNGLKSIVQGATTVEKAVSVMQTALEAVVDYDPQNDTVTEYFWHDANGAHVLGDASGYRNDITSSGMDIKQVSTEDSVASFGADGARIGKAGESNVTVSDSGMMASGIDGVPFLKMSTGDYKTIPKSDNYPPSISFGEIHMQTSRTYAYASAKKLNDEIPNGTTVGIILTLSLKSYDTYNSMLVDWGSGSGDWGGYPYTSNSATLDTSFDIVKGTDSSGTLKRQNINQVNGDSFDLMVNYEYTASTNQLAIGICLYMPNMHGTWQTQWVSEETKISVSDSYNLYAAVPSFTLGTRGYSSHGNGAMSFVEGRELIASGDEQFVIGRYNVEDANGTYAAIIGNGTAQNARSNALTVDWSGNVGIAGDVKDMSGNQLYADASHTHAASDITGIAFRSGIETITPVSQGIASKSVSFDTDMPGKPVVTVTLGTAVSAQLSNWHLSVTSTSASGFTLNVYNAGTNTTARNVCWMAIYQA